MLFLVVRVEDRGKPLAAALEPRAKAMRAVLVI
jgi:hypothetical protein